MEQPCGRRRRRSSRGEGAAGANSLTAVPPGTWLFDTRLRVRIRHERAGRPEPPVVPRSAQPGSRSGGRSSTPRACQRSGVRAIAPRFLRASNPRAAGRPRQRERATLRLRFRAMSRELCLVREDSWWHRARTWLSCPSAPVSQHVHCYPAEPGARWVGSAEPFDTHPVGGYDPRPVGLRARPMAGLAARGSFLSQRRAASRAPTPRSQQGARPR